MEKKNEEYNDKAYNVFNLLNQFRANPRQLARHLNKLKKYLDKETNILSEPDKMQIQMIEGEKIIDEAVKYLKSLSPIPPLEWDDSLTKSAQEHVHDIGPKGLLSYKSSKGIEPEKRITKYGTYIESLGENIDYGPNDEIGIIVSMTLDDGEAERPNRENLFKSEFKKVGIACGPHKTEYQMCVMDFASEFFPKKIVFENIIEDQFARRGSVVNLNPFALRESIFSLGGENPFKERRGSEINLIDVSENNPQTQNKENINYIKSSEKADNIINNNINNIILNQEDDSESENETISKVNNNILNKNGISEIDQLKQQVKSINLTKKIIQKKIEIFTTVTYRLEDGSQRTVNEVKTHIIKEPK